MPMEFLIVAVIFAAILIANATLYWHSTGMAICVFTLAAIFFYFLTHLPAITP